MKNIIAFFCEHKIEKISSKFYFDTYSSRAG